ncbi:hypothetical protein [Aurantimonas endophytica]|uniref:Beta-barrel assembly complex subunit BamF n=1 Tax=Aurantimonas endophytica TaxID=1522175 RepID=A0A7W6HAS4_9HYPH|nr:hypothetical protein [Aurantimonas endophytica]MBB4001769.1 hypothetical protein [Aurantimonas endophytica]MCO6402594.1 hypothetical protein [Aurantimonas endophytica]
MIPLSLLRTLAVCCAIVPAAGCQSFFGDDEDTSVGAMRLAAAPAVPSAQRRDEDGFPLLGAVPRAAAPQLTDAEAQAGQAQLGAMAQQRAATPPSSGPAQVARLQALRQQQAAEVDAALARRPEAQQPAASRPQSPEDVLRQIEAGE